MKPEEAEMGLASTAEPRRIEKLRAKEGRAETSTVPFKDGVPPVCSRSPFLTQYSLHYNVVPEAVSKRKVVEGTKTTMRRRRLRDPSLSRRYNLLDDRKIRPAEGLMHIAQKVDRWGSQSEGTDNWISFRQFLQQRQVVILGQASQ